jgi:hypothetical protein
MEGMRFLLALLLVPSVAFAALTRIEVASRVPFADGAPFGAAGPYERIAGIFHGELDPLAPANAGIVDIGLAPRNARGRVEYRGDFEILRPLDAAKANGTLLYEAVNRGYKLALRVFNGVPGRDPRDADAGGDGFLMRRGFVLAWSGWEPGLRQRAQRLRLEVPAAPGIAQATWDEFLFDVRGRTRGVLTFRPASLDKSRAALYVLRDHRSAPRLLPAAAWEFADERSIRLLPAGRSFPIGVIHQFAYPAVDPPLSGIGFAATRDFAAFLRHDASARDLLGAAVRQALAHGNSQSGRFLRDFLYRGFNEDEAGRRIFDGMHIHLAAARISLNERFAQPSQASSTAHGYRGYGDVSFPFAYGLQRDPFSGKEDGILAACGRRGNCPRVIHSTTSSEYWQSANSLVTTDPAGALDVPAPENVRVYHVASSQHSSIPSMPAGVCALPPNLVVDPRPVARALLVALDRWIKGEGAPPPSAYPRIDDGTLVPAQRLGFPELRGVALPRGPNPRERFAYGEGLPRVLEGAYPVLVPAVDEDGNETGGIRLPELAAPTATLTGWALRAAGAGSPGELCYLDGSHIPFERTAAQRLAADDPRLSLEERYRDGVDYVAKVRAAAQALERKGYLLGEDAARAVARAVQSRSSKSSATRTVR